MKALREDTFFERCLLLKPITTSKMDSKPDYHKVSDQVETLDMNNMAMIIKSVALSAKTIISGKDSPSRVKVEELR